MQGDAVFAILAMALATYLTRISGLVVGQYLPRRGRIKRALDALPPAVLTAVVAPAILAGPAEAIAGLATFLASLRLSLMPAMIIGVIVVVICRSGLGLP